MCVSVCVCAFHIAILEPWPWSKDTVQHGPLVSRADIWEQSEQRQLADTATGLLVPGSSVVSMLVSDQPVPLLLKWVGTQIAAADRYTHKVSHPPLGVWFFWVKPLSSASGEPLSYLSLKGEAKSPKSVSKFHCKAAPRYWHLWGRVCFFLLPEHSWCIIWEPLSTLITSLVSCDLMAGLSYLLWEFWYWCERKT